MLKQLLKYEFKATKSLYFGLYLALALLSVVLGVTFRQEHALAHSTSFQNLEVILMIVYVSVILAIAVLCFVNTIQRFYQNLLGREGYLMHTLPVNENQLILSKLLTSMVWVLCSGLVGIVCITVMVSIGVIDQETFGMVDWNSWKQLWQMVDSMMYCCFNFQRLPAHKGKVTYYAEKLALTLVPSFKARYKLWKGAEKRLSRYSLADAEYVSSFGEGATIMRQRFPIRWFRHPAYLEFEGHQMPVPEDYDKWLTISYGDYMQLPPPEERVYRHDAVFIDLEHSYKQYKGIHYCVDEKKA